MLSEKTASYYAELKADIERCAASFEKERSAQPVVVLDVAQMRQLGESLDAAVLEARGKARLLVVRHHKQFHESPLFTSCSLLRPIGQNRRELSVTQSLGWLFDPQAEHGLRGLLLRAFLSLLSDDCDAARTISGAADSEISVYTEFALNDANRADILIAARGAAVVIEAKVDAKEGASQTERYSRDFGTRYPVCAYVYLTPGGKHPAAVGFQPIRFLELARAFLAALPEGRDADGFFYARYFVAGLLEDFCDVLPSIKVDEVLHGNSFALETLLEDRSDA